MSSRVWKNSLSYGTLFLDESGLLFAEGKKLSEKKDELDFQTLELIDDVYRRVLKSIGKVFDA